MTIRYVDFLSEPLRQIEKIFVLSKRNLMARYRRNLFGVFWSLLNPLITTFVLWMIFVQIFANRFNIDISYAQYVLSGILFTNLIQTTLLQIGDSITSTGSLVTKVSINPLSMVISVALAGIGNFLIGLVSLVIYTSFAIGKFQWQVIAIVPWLALVVLLLAGLGIWIAIAYSKFYDLTNIISVALMLLNYVTPIFYPVEMLHGLTRRLIEFNPLTVLLNYYRGFTINYSTFSTYQFLVTTLFIIINFLLATYFLFKKWPEMVKRI